MDDLDFESAPWYGVCADPKGVIYLMKLLEVRDKLRKSRKRIAELKAALAKREELTGKADKTCDCGLDHTESPGPCLDANQGMDVNELGRAAHAAYWPIGGEKWADVIDQDRWRRVGKCLFNRGRASQSVAMLREQVERIQEANSRADKAIAERDNALAKLEAMAKQSNSGNVSLVGTVDRTPG